MFGVDAAVVLFCVFANGRPASFSIARSNEGGKPPVGGACNALEFAWGNYTDLFGKFTFGKYLWNSVFITVIATLITLLFNSMAAFALSKYRFSGQKAVYLLIIGTLMIPPTIILVPVFLVINEVGLLNSLWGVILPAVATPTGVFLLRQYMLTIPDELIEAARMDHASEWRIYWRIVLPLLKPALGTLGLITFIASWNNFIGPLIILRSPEMYTLPLALRSLQSPVDTEWGALMAGSAIAVIPLLIIFIFSSRRLIAGLTSGAVRG